MDAFKRYCWNILIWLTQGINTIVLAGSPDESTSSRAFRLQHHTFWRRLKHFINWLLRDDQHCYKAYVAEAEKAASWRKHTQK